MFSKLLDKIEEKKELKKIEKEAYENEKPKADAIAYAEKVNEARQQGLDKANRVKSSGSSSILEKIQNYNEKMNVGKEPSITGSKKVELFKLG